MRRGEAFGAAEPGTKFRRAGLVLALAMVAAACGGPKKKALARQDFQAVSDYVDKNMRSAAVTPAERKSYTLSQLGAPHHVEGDTQFWYSSAVDCYYLELGADGWTSWGTGATADCKNWAVKP